MQVVRRLLASVGMASLVVALVGAACLVVLAARHEKLLSVQTASMMPTFKPGDAVIVKLNIQNPAIGSVITYRSPESPRVLVTHRLVQSRGDQLITAGDALKTPDKPVSKTQIVGEATTVLPGLGTWLDRLHQPLGLVAFVYVPAVVLVTIELKRVLKASQPPQYQAFGYR